MKTNSKLKTILIYTLIFAVIVGFIVGQYYLNGRSLINLQGDGYRQDFRAVIYLKDYLSAFINNLFTNHRFVLPEFDFSIGEGADINQTIFHGMASGFFSFLYLFVSNKHLYIMHDVIVVLRLYFAGLAFIYMCSYKGKENSYGVALAASTYVFSFVAIASSLIKCYNFTNPLIILPVVIVGIDKIFNNEKPYVLIFSVFMMVLYDFYFFYMIAISAFVYTIVKSVFYKADIKQKLTIIIKIGVFAAVGMLLGAISLFPALGIYIGNPRIGLKRSMHLLFPEKYYRSLINTFIIADFNQSTTFGGFGILSIFSLVLLFKKPFNKTALSLVAINTIFSIFPVFSSIYNGFSYPTDRWCFVTALLFAYLVAEKYDDLLNLKKNDYIYFLATLVMVVIIALSDARSRLNLYIIVLLLCVFVIFGIVIIKNKKIKNIVVTVSLIACYLLSMLNFLSPSWWNYVSRGSKYKIVSDYHTLEEEVLDEINDDSFYRYSLDEYNNSNTNSSINSKYNSTQFYWSGVNSIISEYRDDLGLLDHSSFHFDNYNSRYPLMSLAGVKYMLIKNKDTVIPANYNYLSTIKEVDVYVNDSADMFHLYDKKMSKDEWLELSQPEREVALLEYAIVEDDADKTDYQPVCQKYLADVAVCENLTISNNTITVNEAGAKLVYSIKDFDENSELYCLITGLQWKHNNPAWNKNLQAGIIFNAGDKKAELGHKDVDHNRYSSREDYVVNLGKISDKTQIELTFDTEGVYGFDELSFYKIDGNKEYEKYNEISNLDIEDLKVDNNISFKIRNKKDGILNIAVPYSNGFKAYVDGRETKLLRVNVEYMGLMLDKGEHVIELKYKNPYMTAGAITSTITAILLIVNHLYYKKRKTVNN